MKTGLPARPLRDAANAGDMTPIRALAVSKRYRRRQACDDIHMVVHAGEIFGLLGPNGAGKSTFVKMVLGLVHPSAGAIRLFGGSPLDRRARRRIGYLPELFRYQSWLSAQEVVRLHARLLGMPDGEAARQTERTLEQTGLLSRARDRVQGFSKGMQQRLGLAASLVGDPDLLILDEPTSAMDPVGRHDVGELLKTLRARGKTVFLNSHLLSDMEDLCDRVALLRQGRVLYTGELDAITRGEGGFRIRTGPLPDAARLALLQETGAQVRLREDGVELTVRVLREKLPPIHRILAAAQVDVYEVEPIRQTLEAWFVDSLRSGGEAFVDDRPADHS